MGVFSIHASMVLDLSVVDDMDWTSFMHLVFLFELSVGDLLVAILVNNCAF